jgi:thiol-disulfide isomerase/thioredoxin
VEELLAASSQAYNSHGGYSHHLVWSYGIEIPSEGRSVSSTGNHTLEVAPDGRFRFGEFDGVTAYVNGTDMIAHRPYSGNYEEISLEAGQSWPDAVPVAGRYIRMIDPASILATGDVADWLSYPLLDADSAELIHDGSAGRIGIRATFDGSSLFGGPDDVAELWFDADTYMLVAARVDSTAAFMTAMELPESTEGEAYFALEVFDIRTGPDARLAAIDFAPRSQDKLVAKMVPEPAKRKSASVLAYIGEPAPAINTTTLGSESFELASLQGDVVLIDFWASWCGSCLRSKPGMKSIGETFADEDFQIVSVSLDNVDHRENVEHLVEKSGINGINILDPENKISTDFRVIVQPTFVLIDADGVIRHAQMGALIDEKLDALREEIKRLLDAADQVAAL